MRRTLLLALALPAVLIGAGATSTSAPDDLRRPSDTSDSTAPPYTAVPSPAPATLAPPAVGGDTSDGADPAVRPLPPADTAQDGRDASSDEGPAPTLVSAEGFLIAPGGEVAGSGPRWRYSVEVEPATGLDLEEVVLDVTSALHDDRSWSSTRTLEHVGDPAKARIRLVIATPDTVDRLCAEVGLRTAGIFSCWNGRFAALNAWRWDAGAEGFEDIETYRRYLVNHEFGHGLGYGHLGCPAEGSPAPVMMQQSKSLDGCTANGWPFP